MKYEKGSFVLIPNRKHLRLRSLGARAVYTELCSMCDAYGRCFPSRKLLAANILMSENSVDRFIEELVESGLLSKTHRSTDKGAQTSNLYQIMLLPLPTGERAPSPPMGLPPSPPMGNEVYPVLTQSNEGARASESAVRIVLEEERPPKESKAKYPHSKEVFSWFPRPEKSWVMNTTELKHAELLWERGESAVKKAIAYHEKHKDDEGYGYVVVKPSQLEGKWNDIAEYARRTK